MFFSPYSFYSSVTRNDLICRLPPHPCFFTRHDRILIAHYICIHVNHNKKMLPGSIFNFAQNQSTMVYSEYLLASLRWCYPDQVIRVVGFKPNLSAAAPLALYFLSRQIYHMRKHVASKNAFPQIGSALYMCRLSTHPSFSSNDLMHIFLHNPKLARICFQTME